MTFAAFETSRDAGNPVDLYYFRYGSDPAAYYAYTDADFPITVDHGDGPVTYDAVPITRGEISSTGTLDRSTLEVQTDRSVELADLFRVYPPSQVVTLIIRQSHLDDPDEEYPVVWTGRVVASSRKKDSTVSYSCEPVATSMRRPGLRRHYQYGCPHALYGTQCGANKAAATVTGTVASISGSTVTLDAGWNGSFAAAKFLGGMIEYTNDDGETEIRSILRVTGDTLSISGLLRDLTVDATISVILGCSRQMGDCKDLHDNIVNYGGQPWIPLKNPIGMYNNYY